MALSSYSGGAPTSAYSSITPSHPGLSQTLPGGFFLYSSLVDCGGNYVANQAYTGKCIQRNSLSLCYFILSIVKLEGGQSFKGFLIQARQFGSSIPIGSF